MKKYKNWEYVGRTPLHGNIFHHKTRKTILIVYHNWIRLFDFISLGTNYPRVPACANKIIERKIIY